MSITLMYLSSEYIVSYITRHPIDWCDRYKSLARRGGAGDRAGVTPTPAVGEFLSILSKKQTLFTQHDYVIHCKRRWTKWWDSLDPEQEAGVTAKLFRNFYPSMIDSLHVYALFSEAGLFDICYLDAYADAIGKTDLTLKRGDKVLKVALMGPGRFAREDRDYKLTYRNNGNGVDAVEVQLSFDRVQEPGNKRWFRLSDFAEIITDQSQKVA